MSENPPENDDNPQAPDAEQLLKQVNAQIQARRATTEFSRSRVANRQLVWLIAVLVFAFAAIGILYFLLSQMQPPQNRRAKPKTEQSR